jgi:RimJ/RimL family protein N-acetyltransferase
MSTPLPSEPTLDAGPCRLRPWRLEDLDALVRHADDAEVSRGLRDRFPYPYTREAGEAFLRSCLAPHDDWRLAIEIDGGAAGGLGFRPGEDVHRHGAELGYWLARAYWGRGLVEVALRCAVPVAMDQLQLLRLAAGVYANNRRSMRVLEKLGFEREGVNRRAVVKRGELLDVVVYALTRGSLTEPPRLQRTRSARRVAEFLLGED